MRINSKPIRVKLESPDGDAVITFPALKANTLLRLQVMIADASGKAARLEEIYRDVLSSCISVENLSDDDGPITPEKVKAMEIPFDIVNAIVVGYMNAGADKFTGAEPKNESSAPVS